MGGLESAAGRLTQAPSGADDAPAEGGGGLERAATSNPGTASSSPGTRSSGSEANPIRAAVAAPLRELLAYVWPAIALGPFGDALVTQLVTQLLGLERESLPPGYALGPSLSSATTPAGGDPRPSAPAAQTGPSDAAPFYAAHGGGMSVLAIVVAILASLVGVVALARLTVGEDLFSTRWLH